MFSQSLAAFALPILSLICTTRAQAANSSSSSLIDVLAAHANLSSFHDLLRDQLPATLNALEKGYAADKNPITILAPSNHAFDSLQYSDVLSPMFANNETAAMSQVVAYHVLEGSWTPDNLNTSFQFIPSMTASTNFSNVSNGQRVGAILQNAPPASQYKWEMVFTSGEATRSVVTIQSIPFAGGVIQVIDNFLIPPSMLAPTIDIVNFGNPPSAMTSFLGAINSMPNSSLAAYLNTTKDVTIFIPSNAAFGTVAGSLMTMNNATRLNLLSYHVIPGLMYSSDFANATSLNMLNNATAELRFYPNSFFIDSARITQSDILIYNGVVHIIDVVLDPNTTSALPNPTSATQMPVLATAGSGDFNASDISRAPFMTYLPDYVPTETPTITSTFSDNYAARTSSSMSATATTSKKSDAVALRGSGWTTSMALWLFTMLLTFLTCTIL